MLLFYIVENCIPDFGHEDNMTFSKVRDLCNLLLCYFNV